MNNETLKKLLTNAETPYGNEIIDILIQDFDATIHHESMEETYRGREETTVLKLNDEYTMVEQDFFRIGYKDYDHNVTKACMVSRRDEVITRTWFEPIEE